MIMARLLQIYPAVLIPFGNGRRYDMVVECSDGSFIRIQCKTGWVQYERIIFKTKSSGRNYLGDADKFAVYCVATDQVYLVPVADFTAAVGTLRLSPPLNNQVKGVRYARDYELAAVAQ